MRYDVSRSPVEVRLHGRGGQGTVTLAALLVDAAFRTGHHALGFPSFGTERTGAPVTAFVRMSDRRILDRSAVSHPRIVIVQDPTLTAVVDVLDGIESDGLVIVNATEVPRAIARARVAMVPATALARACLGKPVTSTAMLGAFAAATGLVTIDAAVSAIADRFEAGVARRNEELARAAFDALCEREAVA